MADPAPRVALVDCALGNLFSIAHALGAVGLQVDVTHDPEEIRAADGIVLPGVGAFGRAMEALAANGIDRLLKEQAEAGRPIMGICLGMQLLFDESEEFGSHRGLGIIAGRVVRLRPGAGDKVPQVGWNRIDQPAGDPARWSDTLLGDIAPGSYMYFVHSYRVVPDDEGIVLGTTVYGTERYCSALSAGSVTAFQFHPERSGEDGQRIIRRFSDQIRARR